jgi:hypothetical protein
MLSHASACAGRRANADLAARQARQLVERARLGRARVSGGEHADVRCPLAQSVQGGDLLQHVLQLANAGHRDEADEDVDLVRRSELAADLLPQRRRALSGSEQPGRRQTDLGRHRELPVPVDGPEQAQRRRDEVNDSGRGVRTAVGSDSLAQRHQQRIDQLELAEGPVGVVAGDIV